MYKENILIIGPLPPPTGGMQTVMEQMINLNMNNYNLIPFNVSKNKLIKSNIIFNIAHYIYKCITLPKYIIKYKTKIIHIHLTSRKDFWQKYILLKIARIFKSKIIIHIHGGEFKKFIEESARKNKILDTLNEADTIIVLSKGWKKYFDSILISKKIEVIENVVDTVKISKYRKKKHKHDTVKLLFVGRIEKQKGIYELLDTINYLKEEKITLDIMGQFMNNEKEIKDRCKKLGIINKVNFLGEIHGDKRFEYFSKADVFILPSHWEALPVSILEAMTIGLPIIATKVGAIPEIMNKNNGIILKNTSTKEISNAIKKCSDHTKRMKWQKNNLKKMKKKYSTITFCEKIEKIYSQLK